MKTTGFLFDIKRFAVHDGPGIRTTLFFKGCPLRCLWCHNPEGIVRNPQLAYHGHTCIRCGECLSVCPEDVHELSDAGHLLRRDRCVACGRCVPECLGRALRLYGKSVTVAEAAKAALEDRDFFAQSGGGVTLSGGEPLLQPEFCRDLLAALKGEGIRTAVDTCGFVLWTAVEAVLPFVDLFLFDVKHADDAAHRKLTGQGNVLIFENLRKLSARGCRIEIRMPLVPGCNDSTDALEKIGAILGPLPIESMKVLPYHAMARSRYAALGMKDTMPEVSSPSGADLMRAVSILRACGVNAISGLD